MEAASNAGGASGASGDGPGFSLIWPLGSKFAAAMLMQSCGLVYFPGGGWMDLSVEASPLLEIRGSALYQPFEKGSVQG